MVIISILTRISALAGLNSDNDISFSGICLSLLQTRAKKIVGNDNDFDEKEGSL